MITRHRPPISDSANRLAYEVDWQERPRRPRGSWSRAWCVGFMFVASAFCWVAIIGFIILVAALLW